MTVKEMDAARKAEILAVDRARDKTCGKWVYCKTCGRQIGRENTGVGRCTMCGRKA